MTYMTLTSIYGLGMMQRTAYGFLCSFDGSTESQIDMVFMKDPHGSYRFLRQMRDDIGGGKGDDDIAAAIAQMTASAGQGCRHAAAYSFQLSSIQWHIHGQNDDDRTLILLRPAWR